MTDGRRTPGRARRPALEALVLLLVLAGFGPDGDERAARVEAAAEAALARSFPAEAHRLDVRIRRIDTGVPAEGPLRVRFPAAAELPRGTVRTTVLTPRDGGGWEEAGAALLYVAHYDTVLVARADVPRGEPVTEADLASAWIETTTLAGEPVVPGALPEDAVAVRSIAEGRVLRRHDVRAPYAAALGAPVRMHYQRRGLAMTLTCTAREAGHTGEAIRLYCPDTRTAYRARLTGPGAATWIQTLSSR